MAEKDVGWNPAGSRKRARCERVVKATQLSPGIGRRRRRRRRGRVVGRGEGRWRGGGE